jgi:hypothetical protein
MSKRTVDCHESESPEEQLRMLRQAVSNLEIAMGTCERQHGNTWLRLLKAEGKTTKETADRLAADTALDEKWGGKFDEMMKIIKKLSRENLELKKEVRDLKSQMKVSSRRGQSDSTTK